MNIALLFHGDSHTLRTQKTKNSSVICLSGINPTIESLKNIVTIDVRPEVRPTHVLDLTEPAPEWLSNRFDVMTAEYPPFSVYKSRTFFENVLSMLVPGGTFIMFPPGFNSKGFSYKDRSAFAEGVLRSHAGFVSYRKGNRLLFFTKAPCALRAPQKPT